jgi:hypothetical protein
MPECAKDSRPPWVLHGDAAAVGDLPVIDEAPALALGAEAQVLQHHDHGAGEAVVDPGHVDVFGATGHGVGLGTDWTAPVVVSEGIRKMCSCV